MVVCSGVAQDEDIYISLTLKTLHFKPLKTSTVLENTT